MAEVLHIFQCLAHGKPMREFEEALAMENKGLKDCIHGQAGSLRQVLVMAGETLEEFGIAPGQAKENITTYGIVVSTLALGQRLRIGEALLEVSEPCPTCHLMNEIRPGLQDQIQGMRGVMCQVIEAGRIRRGDLVEIEDQGRTAS